MPPTSYKIIVLVGDSNSEEFGVGPFEPTADSNDALIFQVGRFGADANQIVPMGTTLQFWNAGGGHGHGVPMARLFAAKYLAPGEGLIIVPAAHSDMSILWLTETANGSYPAVCSDLFAKLDIALAYGGGDNTIAFLAMFAHEPDIQIARNPLSVNYPLMQTGAMYRAAMVAFIDKFRARYGAVPMVFGLASDAFLPNNPLKFDFARGVRNGASDRPLCAIADTVGLGDNHAIDPALPPRHINAAGQEDWARRALTAIDPFLTGVPAVGMNYIDGADFDFLPPTPIVLAANTLTTLGHGWFAYSLYGETTISRVNGIDGSLYGLCWQRNPGAIHRPTLYLYYQVPSRLAAHLAGKSIAFSISAQAGADFSANGDNYRVGISTANGIDETFDPGTFRFPSTTVVGDNLSFDPTPSPARYDEIAFTVPADCRELLLRQSWAPTATPAGAADLIVLSKVKLEEGSIPTPFQPAAP